MVPLGEQPGWRPDRGLEREETAERRDRAIAERPAAGGVPGNESGGCRRVVVGEAGLTDRPLWDAACRRQGSSLTTSIVVRYTTPPPSSARYLPPRRMGRGFEQQHPQAAARDRPKGQPQCY